MMQCFSEDLTQKEMIKVEGFSYRYPDGRLALNEINFSVKSGECLGIIGPNGAGKTTLLLSLVGILKGTGTIEIMGMPLGKKSIKEIRKKVGFVFQDPDTQLFSPTVFEDVAFGPLNMGLSEDEVKGRVRDALFKVGLSGFEERLSHHLSIGEKKRVALATVLSMDPQILLLDEPSSGLDPKARRGLINLFKNIKKAKIIATHDLFLVETLCNRMLILNSGSVVWEGAPYQILHNEELLEKYGL